MATITELKKEFLSGLRALGAIRYTALSGSWRGDKKICGPFLCVEFPAEMRIGRCLRKKVRNLTVKFYGEVKYLNLRQGTHRMQGEDFATKHLEVVLKEE